MAGEHCIRCGEVVGTGEHSCDRDGRVGTPFDPPRYCADCGAKLIVQVLPQGTVSRCLRCTRRAARSAA